MIRYSVRARALVDIVSDIKRRKLIISPYFQRDFVWRTIHKIDFIDTILRGYPFPQIFLAKGDVDVETMSLTSCVVDGQQRLNAILGFLENSFLVNGKTYSALEKDEKEQFLKYEVPTIELDLRHNDPSVIEIFKRLNRTFYSLSNIERLSTEFASSEFMLVAKTLCGDLHKVRPQPLLEFMPDLEDEIATEPRESSALSPVVPEAFFEWADTREISSAHRYILGEKVFNGYEISRKVHLMFTLNVLATLERGFYARNEMVQILLESYADEYPNRDLHSFAFNKACQFLCALDFEKGSYWNNKANAFSLLVVLANSFEVIDAIYPAQTKQRLDEFTQHLPSSYALAAREAVNNKRERMLRNDALQHVIFGHLLTN